MQKKNFNQKEEMQNDELTSTTLLNERVDVISFIETLTENAFSRENKGLGDIYVVLLDPSGRLRYSTLIGSSGYGHVQDITTDAVGFFSPGTQNRQITT